MFISATKTSVAINIRNATRLQWPDMLLTNAMQSLFVVTQPLFVVTQPLFVVTQLLLVVTQPLFVVTQTVIDCVRNATHVCSGLGMLLANAM